MKVLLLSTTLFLFLPAMAVGQDSITPPKIVTNPDPVYRVGTSSLGYGGSVVVSATINKQGKLTIRDASGPAAPCSGRNNELVRKIRDAVLAAAKQTAFEPALKNGKPVDVETTVTYKFDASGKPWRENSSVDRGRIVDAGVLQGRVKYMARPDYPASARSTRISGAVPVAVVTDTAGKIIAAGAVGGHPSLRNSAETTACASSIEPVILNGAAVSVTGIVTYSFVP